MCPIHTEPVAFSLILYFSMNKIIAQQKTALPNWQDRFIFTLLMATTSTNNFHHSMDGR